MTYELRAALKAKMRNPGGAILDFNRAMEINENFVTAYNNRGIIKSELGNYPGALVDFNKALEIDPNYARSYTIRGKNY